MIEKRNTLWEKFHLSTWSKINNTTFNKMRLVLLNDMTKSKTKHI